MANRAGRQWNAASEIHACDDGKTFTAPVGSYRANAFGLHDMLGNVWEWAEDCWHGSYDGAPRDGAPWTGGECANRVLRGGSWGLIPRGVRSANRAEYPASRRGTNNGFRVARTD